MLNFSQFASLNTQPPKNKALSGFDKALIIK
jgi:hypothetical protein